MAETLPGTRSVTRNLDLAPIGNCAISALIDRQGRFVWCCAPRVDSDPFFCNLLSADEPDQRQATGFWSVDVEGAAQTRQAYLRNTAVLRTEITDAAGQVVEILDFAPRFPMHGRGYRPTAFIRLIRPVVGAPHITIRMRPTTDWGAEPCPRTNGSNHIRYIGHDVTLRLTTNMSVSHILDERTFRLEESIALFLGPDEPFSGDVRSSTAAMLADTTAYWMHWVRTLAVPLEWNVLFGYAAVFLFAGYPTWAGYGGTSVSSPIWAAIQALVNQKTGQSWGNSNTVLYQLAVAEYGASGNAACNSSLGNAIGGSCYFNDVTQGDNVGACAGMAVRSMAGAAVVYCPPSRSSSGS